MEINPVRPGIRPVVEAWFSGMERAGQNSKVLVISGLGLVSLLAFLFYVETTGYSFFTDDFLYLSQNRFQYPHFIDNFAWFWQSLGLSGTTFYRPFFRVVWGAEYSLFGENPFYWHLAGVLLYSANTALLYLLAWLLSRKIWVALLAGLLFVVHPAHVEPVSWIADHGDLLAALLSLTATILYIRSRQTATRLFYALALPCFALALMSKESAAGFFLVPLLYETLFELPGSKGLIHWFKNKGWLRVLTRQLPFWAILGGYLGLRLAIFGTIGGYSPKVAEWTRSFEHYAFHDAYLRWLFHPLPAENLVVQLLIGLLLLFLFAGVIFWQKMSIQNAAVAENGEKSFKPASIALFGMGWIVLFLLPVLTTEPFMRYSYLATVGLALMLAVLLAPLTSFPVTGPKPSKKSFSSRLISKASRVYGARMFTTGKLLILVALLVMWTLDAQNYKTSWREASDVTRLTLSQLKEILPEVENNAVINVGGLPGGWTKDKAPPFSVGYASALQLLYNNPTLTGESLPGILIAEKNLPQSHFVEYQNGRLVRRDDLRNLFQARLNSIQEKWETTSLNWTFDQAGMETGWKITYGEGNLVVNPAANTLVINLPKGGAVATPAFSLPASSLGTLELRLKATKVKEGVAAPQIFVHWLVKTPDGVWDKVRVPLAIQADGANHTYRIIPPDMSVFYYNDEVSQVQLEIPPGLAPLELEQMQLYQLKDHS